MKYRICILEFDMKYHILHDFRTSTPLKEKASDYIKELPKLKLLTNFDINLASFPDGVVNYALNV